MPCDDMYFLSKKKVMWNWEFYDYLGYLLWIYKLLIPYQIIQMITRDGDAPHMIGHINAFSCGPCRLLLMVKIMLMSLFSFEFKTNSFHRPVKMCVGLFSYQSAIKEGMVITAYLFNLLLRMLYKHNQRHLCWEILFD